MRPSGCLLLIAAALASVLAGITGVVSTAVAVVAAVTIILVALVVRVVLGITLYRQQSPEIRAAAREFFDASSCAHGQHRDWLEQVGGHVQQYTVEGVTIVFPGPKADVSAIVRGADGKMRTVKLTLARDAEGKWSPASIFVPDPG